MKKPVRHYVFRGYVCDECLKNLEEWGFRSVLEDSTKIEHEMGECDLCKNAKPKVTVTKDYEHLPL